MGFVLPGDFEAKVVSGAKWTAVSRWGSLLVTWPATILLARFLAPQDFGLVALVGVFVGFAILMAEGGLSATIVLGERLEEDQYRRLHGWSLTLYSGACLLLILAATAIERLYGIPGLRWAIVALALSVILDGMVVVPMARLRRALRFRELALISSARAITQAVVSVAFAAWGLGYWALVIGHIGGLLVCCTLTLRSLPVLPMLPAVKGMQKVLKTSAQLLIASSAAFVGRRSDAWIGAATVGAGPLGGYVFMKGLAEAPVDKLSGIMVYVSGSAFGNMAEDPERVRRGVVRLTRITATMMLPMFAGIALVAGDLARGLLGHQWIPFVPALQLYCAYAAGQSLTVALNQGAVAVGGARDVASTGLMQLLILPPAFFVLGNVFGPTGLAAAWLLPLPLITERLIHSLTQHVGLRRRDVLRAVGMPVACTAIMAAVVTLVSLVPVVAEASPVLRMLVQITVGTVAYLLLVLALQPRDLVWAASRFAPRAFARLGRTAGRLDAVEPSQAPNA